VFQALADPTRRAVLERLSNGPAPMSDLARPFDMALPSFSQHLDVLEAAGLIDTRRDGRWKLHTLNPAPLGTMLDRWRRPPTATRINPEAEDANPPGERPGR